MNCIPQSFFLGNPVDSETGIKILLDNELLIHDPDGNIFGTSGQKYSLMVELPDKLAFEVNGKIYKMNRKFIENNDLQFVLDGVYAFIKSNKKPKWLEEM